jgi:hypothetical protein
VIFSPFDAPRPWQPKTETSPDIINQIHQLIWEDWGISAKSIAERMSISRERVVSIIHEDLDMRKFPAKWVPKCPNAEQNVKVPVVWATFRICSIGASKCFPVAIGDHGQNLVKSLWKGDKATINGVGVYQAVLFLHNSAPAPQALATKKKLAYLGFHCLDHPTYSPDLDSSDYHGFPGLKKQLKVCHFSSDARGHCSRGDLVGRTTFWLFFDWLAKVRAMGK